MYSLNNDWEFTSEWTADFLRGRGAFERVRLPHTVRQMPLHYALDSGYQTVSGYRRLLRLPDDARDKRVFLRFEGAAHIATVFLDGRELMTHRCGYTAFDVELTGLMEPDRDHLLSVRLDSTENGEVPPFGGTIDYLTFGGLYRPCYLYVKPQRFIRDLAVTTPDLTTAQVRLTLDGPGETALTRVMIRAADGQTVLMESGAQESYTLKLPTALPWSDETPNLYTLNAALIDEEGAEQDAVELQFGFRTAEFRADGFYLNGRKTFLRGLNRHQCYPYIGYAAPESLEREDARILKEELGVNAVRTSHYPQGRAFIDACDRLGLMVFTEMPGWQHIGDEQWKEQAIRNVREMVTEYRSHPSVILWGVRINESGDDDAFYRRTNEEAHRLDPTRATSGVRCITKSALLEDVYAYNDFSYAGAGAGVRQKDRVTADTKKAFLVSEHTGHMFPTKSFDHYGRRQEQALRHARVLNDAMASGLHAGCFGWCMFDYPTHRDFGAGDRVCYHGVMDAFRNPKTAAAMYLSQQDDTPVLEVGSSMAIGDYPNGDVGDVYLFTNADEVRVYKNDRYVTALRSTPFKALPHGPKLMDDPVGDLLKDGEGLTGGKEKDIRHYLLALRAAQGRMTPALRLRAAWLRTRYGVTDRELSYMFARYADVWGGAAAVWRFDAVRDGQVVLSRSAGPGESLRLSARASADTLYEGDTYDMALVRIMIVDQYDRVACYQQLPLHLNVTGAAELVGPPVVTAEGGMGGCLIRTVGREGEAVLTVVTEGMAPVELRFRVVKTA